MHVPPPHPGGVAENDADQPTPVHDMFCQDEEYYPAVKAADIYPVIQPTIPQLDGSSEYSPTPPTSSLSVQLCPSDLGFEVRNARRKEREREKDLDEFQKMIEASCRF